MAEIIGYPAREALKVIDGPLAGELAIHRFDVPSRSKAQLFAVGGALGKQFALVLGSFDVASGMHAAQQTRLVFERCNLPDLPGIEPCGDKYNGHRVSKQLDSRLSPPNQVSCLVADETALRAMLYWYAGRTRDDESRSSLESVRIAKAAADAGFDITPEQTGGWTVFRSTAFPVLVGIAPQTSGDYRVGLTDETIGERLAVEFGWVSTAEFGPWATRFDGIAGYARLFNLLQRIAAISRVLHQEGLREFVVTTRTPPNGTEAIREVVQRVGQDIFRRNLIVYWGGRCAVTGLELVDVLRASHIKPWSDCESDVERLDVFNGLLLAPHLDALFDKGWVTFSDDGELLRSPQLEEHHLTLLGLDRVGLHRCQLADGHRRYLAWHRAKVFQVGERDGAATS